MENKDIIVKYSPKEHKFIIYKCEKLMGNFTVIHIIKYITSKSSKIFLKNIEFESSIEVIEKFFCKMAENENISLVGYFDSPLTGNLEIVMKIYSEINRFETNFLQKEIDKIDNDNEKKKIMEKIKSLVYLILNHSLKLIVNISDAIKNDDSKNELKLSLMQYSVFITNKINYIICDNINDNKNEYKILDLELEQMKKIKSSTENKIKNLESAIISQNKQIQKIINYIDNYDIDDIINDDIVDNNDNYDNEDNKLNLNSSGFNDSDYSYMEENEKKININYLTPKNSE